MKLCILVVEDDCDTRDALVELLQLDGHDVIPVGSLAAALHHLGQGIHPNIVVLDERLPDGLGSDLLAYMKRVPDLAQLPVVIVSASNLPPLCDASVMVMRKPLQIDALLHAIRAMNGATRGWQCATA